jgi:hypothetical protein
MFDALVKLVFSYGCEIWLDHMAREQLKVVHRAFLKSLLGQHHDIQLRRASRVW